MKSIFLLLNVVFLTLWLPSCYAYYDNYWRKRDWGYCRVTCDPHFYPWKGPYFRFDNGGCDIVLVKNKNVEVQARLGDRGNWADVSAVAIGVQIEGQVYSLEFYKDGKLYFEGEEVNDSDLVELPIDPVIGPFQLRTRQGPYGKGYLIAAGPQYVYIAKYWSNTIEIQIYGHRSIFGGSVGACGTFNANYLKSMVGRDGTTSYNYNTRNQFVKDWIVDFNKGDLQIFKVTPTSMPNTCKNIRRDLLLSPRNLTEELAQEACAFLADQLADEDEDIRRACEFDVATTGDVGWASVPAYTNPEEDLDDRCIASTSGTNACVDQGGECVWRCNTNEYNCDTDLCTATEGTDEVATFLPLEDGEVEGCACELPKTSDAIVEDTCSLTGILSFLCPFFCSSFGRIFGLCG